MSESTHKAEIKKRRWINPRVVALLAGMIVIICVLVVVTEQLSPRDRHPAPAISPASSTKGNA